jgi:hypothetical protein
MRTRLRQRLDLLLEFIVLRHQLALLRRTAHGVAGPHKFCTTIAIARKRGRPDQRFDRDRLDGNPSPP